MARFKSISIVALPVHQLATYKIQPNDRIKGYFDAIDWHFIPPLTQALYSDAGAPAFPPVSMDKAILLTYLGEADSERDLAERLSFDIRLQTLCGFDFFETPSHAAFSCFRTRLGAETFYEILHRLIAQAIAIGLIKNLVHTAVDSTHIWACSNKFGIKICTCKGKCDCLKTYTDPDARWGHKTKTYSFFGYKIHLIVDVESHLPLEVIVTPGNASDNTQAIPLLEQATQKHPQLTIQSAAMDAAYDAYDIYQHCIEQHIDPIIALNPGNTQGKTQIGNDLHIDEKGQYYCQRTGLKLVKNGTDPKRKGRQKIVCSPTGDRKTCPFRKECCSDSNVGKTFYVYPLKDLRLVGPIPRGSKLWKTLYNERTASERINAQLKTPKHKLHMPRARGMKNIQVHAYLSVAALLVKAIGTYVQRLSPKHT